MFITTSSHVFVQVQGWWTDSVPTSRGSLRICLMTTPWRSTFTTVTLRTRGTISLQMPSPKDAEEAVYIIVFSSQWRGGLQSLVWVSRLGQEADGSACSPAAAVDGRQYAVRRAVLGGRIHWKHSRSDPRQKPYQHHGEKWLLLQRWTLFKFTLEIGNIKNDTKSLFFLCTADRRCFPSRLRRPAWRVQPSGWEHL